MSNITQDISVRKPVVGRFTPILVLLALFLALEFLAPPFPEFDEMFFKAAGRHLAAGHGFAAPELENYLRLDPPIQRVYSAHPPVYSWLFGEAVRLGGFGWKVCVGYDAVITALLSFCVWGLSRRLLDTLGKAEKRNYLIALLPALAILLFRQSARPDELAMLFGYANIWFLLARPGRVSTAGLSGILAGLTLCTSTGVALGFLPFVTACWLFQVDRTRWPSALAVSAAGAMAAGAICLVPLYLIEPSFLRQFLQHAHVQVVESSAWKRICDALELAWQVAPWRILGLIATIPLCCLGLRANWRTRPRMETMALYVAPIFGFLLLFCLRPVYTYWWFFQPWFMIVALIVAAQRWGSSRRWRMLPAAWLICWLSIAAIWPAKGYCVRLLLPPDQRIAQAEERLRKTIPPHATVMSADAWWMLGADHTIFSPIFADIDDVNRIDFFVAGSNGTGTPGKWVKPANPRYQQWLGDEFEVVRDDLPKEPISLFGRRISRSGYGFGTIVMRRRTLPAATEKPAGQE
jgi:hypothetical protein